MRHDEKINISIDQARDLTYEIIVHMRKSGFQLARFHGDAVSSERAYMGRLKEGMSSRVSDDAVIDEIAKCVLENVHDLPQQVKDQAGSCVDERVSNALSGQAEMSRE